MLRYSFVNREYNTGVVFVVTVVSVTRKTLAPDRWIDCSYTSLLSAERGERVGDSLGTRSHLNTQTHSSADVTLIIVK